MVGQIALFLGQGLGVGTAAHDLDPKRTGAAIQLFDPHEDAFGLRFRQDMRRHPFGQRFQQVQPFRGQFALDRLGHNVIGQDPVHVVVQRIGEGLDLDHDVETQALTVAAFGLEGPDVDLGDIVAQRNPVARFCAGQGLGAFDRMAEGLRNAVAHVAPPFTLAKGYNLAAGMAKPDPSQNGSKTARSAGKSRDQFDDSRV